MSSRLALLTVALASLAAACGNPPEVVPVRNLERPSDMVFTCVARTGAADDTGGLTGAPMANCHPAGARDPEPGSGASRAFGTFGFVTNTARAEVAVVDLDRGRLADLDRAIPGYTMVPVGTLPENLAATQDGCRVVTANRGSCDLAVIDTTKVLRDVFRLRSAAGGVQRVVPTIANGDPLRVAPQEIAFLPQRFDAASTTFSELQKAPLCRAEGTWRAVVTFPACDLVAVVDLPSGRIVDSVRITAEGAVDTGASPQCPIQCGAGAGATPFDAASTPDAAATDGGTADGGDAELPANLGVGALAMVPDGTRVYVGTSGAPFLTALDLNAAAQDGNALTVPAANGRIPLAEGALGVTRLRLTLNPFEPGDQGYLGRWIGRNGRFIYAFARDGSVRVVDLRTAAAGTVTERECDVNVHPDAASGLDLACISVTSGARRRPFAAGPGLRIQSSSNVEFPPPVPRDIAFAQIGDLQGSGVVEGANGYLLASNGRVYLVAVERPSGIANPGPLHTVLDSNSDEPAAVFGVPNVNLSGTDIPFPVRIPLMPAAAPRIEAAGTVNPRYVVFTDQRAIIPGQWAVSWEGVVAGTDRKAGTLETAATAGTPAGAVTDLGANFCRSGVVAGDLLLMAGCSQDADCDVDGAEDRVCHQPAVGAAGLCVPRDQMRRDELVRRCSRFLTSRRRYEVLRSTRTRLELGPKLDEIPKSTLDTCDDDMDCTSPDLAGQPNPYRCQQVRAGEHRRCVRPCEAGGPACRTGFVCEAVGTLDGTRPMCVEAPPPDPACWPQPSRYRIHAGQSFVVTSSGMPPIPTTTEGPGGVCQPDLARNPVFANRIPLRAPVCSNLTQGTTTGDAQNRTPQAADGQWGNPCLYKAPDEGMGGPPRTKALFEGPYTRFVLTNLDTYFGDAASVRFEVDEGFEATVVRVPDELRVTLGTRIVTGPTKVPDSPVNQQNSASTISYPYLYVVDQGPSPRTEGSRGQILRINPRTRVGSVQFDSLYTRDPFHIQ